MKRKAKVKPPIKTADRERLDNLIEMVLTRYDIKDIVSVFIGKMVGYGDRDEVIQELMTDRNYRYQIKEKLEDEIRDEVTGGKVFCEIETQAQEMKLHEFICTHIFPLYNQQQARLFA